MSEHTLPLDLILPENIPLTLLGGMGEPLKLGVVGTDNFDFFGDIGSQIQELVVRVGTTELEIHRVETYAIDNIGALYNEVNAVLLSTENTSIRLEQETTLRAEADSALGTRLDFLKVTTDQNTALIQEETTLRTNMGSALSQQITTQSARVDDAFAKITEESTARATETDALSQQITTIKAQVDTNYAILEEEVSARVDADTATATQISQLTSRITGIDASVIQTSQAVSDLVDGASASWSIRTQARADGKIVQTGIQLGSAVGINGAIRSEIILAANILQLVDGNNPDGNVTAPFIFDTVGGAAYLNTAVIKTASITNAMIGGVIRSDVQNPQTGGYTWSLDKAGNFALNPPSGYGGLRITPQALKVFDDGNVLRVQIGNLEV
jgi:Domain of unknown function (DUF1983)